MLKFVGEPLLLPRKLYEFPILLATACSAAVGEMTWLPMGIVKLWLLLPTRVFLGLCCSTPFSSEFKKIDYRCAWLC